MGCRVAVLLALGALLAGCASAGAGAAVDEPEAGLATVAIEQRAELGGVAVTPLRVEEDSRCPAEVQCVQAGTVRLAVRVEEGGAGRETVLTLGQPMGLIDGRTLRLAAVCPYPRHPGAIVRADYRFTLVLGSEGTEPMEPACTP